MDIFEFELRYLAYTGMNTKFNLNWDQKTVLELVKITDWWTLAQKVQDSSPEELQTATYDTYTQFKKDFIEKNWKEFLYEKNVLSDEPLDSFTIQIYIDRLEYELKVIKEMWFNTYFLIVSDFVIRAKNNNIIVWPGRWSWAGSLLAWFTQITDIDPIPYNLLFERFLNPARVSMPDFDIDFEDQNREKVIEYVIQKYWKDNVCSIWTYMQLAKKASFKDCARVLWLDFDNSNKFSALMPGKWKFIDYSQEDENKPLLAMYEWNETIRKWVEFWEKLEWNMRQLWVHACGIIIAPEAVSSYTPTQYIKENDHTIVSQYDGPTLEHIGLLKMDFLWLRNLSIIRNCIKIIDAEYKNLWKELPQIFKDFQQTSSFQPPLDDELTYEKIFKTWDTTWIFQFESQGMRSYLVKLEASSINDLIAMNALYRPWPMEFIPNYIDRKHGKEKILYLADELRKDLEKKYSKQIADEEEKKLIEDLGPIMDITYWIAVFQEQLMFLVQRMAGFSLAEADILRRWVGKKKLEVIEQLKGEFIEKWATFRNYKKETSKYIYEKMIEPAASYSFNKSHSVCYSRIAFQTAYLKAHYPVEFYAALIRSVEDNTEEMSNYIKETQNHWIIVKTVDINQSFNHVAAIEEYIILGFAWVKGVGSDVALFIEQERFKNWNYIDLWDFLKRCEKIINKKSLEALIKVWAFDCFEDRNVLFQNLQALLDWTRNSSNIEGWLFWWWAMDTSIQLKPKGKATLKQKMKREYECLRIFLSVNPFDWLYNYLKKNTFLSNIQDESYVGNFKLICFISGIQRAKKKWFFIKLEDITGEREIFMKDRYDFELFDVFIIDGYKREWKYISITKMTRTSRKTLIKLSGKSYDENMKAIEAKISRMGKDIKPEPLKLEENLKNEENLEDPILDQNTTEEFDDVDIKPVDISEEKIEKKDLKLPDTIDWMNQVKQVLRDYPWDKKVSIWNLEFFVNQEGEKLLIKLMG